MKKIRIVLIVIIFILIIAIISLISYSKKINEGNFEEYDNSAGEELLRQQTFPRNFTEFHFTYDGSVNTTEIYKKFHNILNDDITMLYLDCDNLNTANEIEEYYNNHKYIIDSIGIANIQNFYALVSMLKNYNVEKLEYENSEVLKNTCKKYSDRTEFNLKVEYKGSVNLKLKVIVYNKKNNNTFINIIPITEE